MARFEKQPAPAKKPAIKRHLKRKRGTQWGRGLDMKIASLILNRAVLIKDKSSRFSCLFIFAFISPLKAFSLVLCVGRAPRPTPPLCLCYMFKLNDGILTFCFRLFVFRFRASLSLSLSRTHTRARHRSAIPFCLSIINASVLFALLLCFAPREAS